MELVGHVKNYDWGELGSSSLVAKLMIANGSLQNVDENVPYAELWMGVHPNGQCTIKKSGEPISSILKEDLSFLFKVLSVQKPLSIQVHPNKEQAKRMHFDRPDIYKDANHKPELLIALSEFKALCGFRPFSEINKFITKITPLQNLLINETDGKFSEFYNTTYLRKLYTNLMLSKPLDVTNTINTIQKDYKNELKSIGLLDIFNTLNEHYPGDVGVLSIFFLNYLNLEAGECIFLEPNDVHAYIYGNGLECMSCSDNVIRGGLTKKFKDVKSLLECISFCTENHQCKLLSPQSLDSHAVLFSPPVPDFSVLSIHLDKTQTLPYTLELPTFPGILCVIEGSRILCLADGTSLIVKTGSIVYLEPKNMEKVILKTLDDPEENLKEFLAYIASQNIVAN